MGNVSTPAVNVRIVTQIIGRFPFFRFPCTDRPNGGSYLSENGRIHVKTHAMMETEKDKADIGQGNHAALGYKLLHVSDPSCKKWNGK